MVSPYLALLRGQVRSQTSYRASFTVDLASNLWATVAEVVTVLVLYRVTTDLGGFVRSEALVMVGLSACAFACADLAVGNIDQLRRYVRTGLLDALLVRPLGVLPQLLAMDLPLRKLSRAGFGVAVLVVFLAAGDIDWDPARVVLAVLAPLGGAAFFAGIFIAGSTVAFWWIESGELANSFAAALRRGAAASAHRGRAHACPSWPAYRLLGRHPVPPRTRHPAVDGCPGAATARLSIRDSAGYVRPHRHAIRLLQPHGA